MQLRTLEAYNNNIRIVEASNSFASVYGIKQSSCLNDLEYFHVINGLPPDLAYDVFEGIAINVLNDIVGYFCKEKIIRLEEIMTKFLYSSSLNLIKEINLSCSESSVLQLSK